MGVGGVWNNTGTFNANGGTVIFNGVTTIGGSSTSIFSSIDITGNLIAPVNLEVGGNWNDTGTFTAGTGTVTLDGSNQSISGTTVFYNLTKTVSSPATLTFEAGQLQTVQGLLKLMGTGGNLLSLRSSVSGVQWKIDPLGVREIGNIDIKDGDNINIMPVECTINCVNSGDNTGFFGTYIAPTVISMDAETWASNLLAFPGNEFLIFDYLYKRSREEAEFYVFAQKWSVDIDRTVYDQSIAVQPPQFSSPHLLLGEPIPLKIQPLPVVAPPLIAY